MLRFFRQIRQRLLAENRFSKYLLYAVGEILLVVIGILIALQINNANEEGKDRMLEKELLTQMLEELRQDKLMLKDAIGMSSIALTSADYIRRAIIEKTPMNDSLAISFTATTIPFGCFQPNLATYNNLNAIGFHFIKN